MKGFFKQLVWVVFVLGSVAAIAPAPANAEEFLQFRGDSDEPRRQYVSKGNPLPIQSNAQQSAFGELLVTQPDPIVQLQFPYGVNPELVADKSNSGTLSVDANRLKLSTGAAANQTAQMTSRTPIKYNPGQGGLVRFTGVFSTGVANSTQLLGIGDAGDGYFFGYDGADFGVLRRHGGNPEIREFQVTTGSTNAETITITLDGDANSITVTNSGNVTTTANEIAADADWSTTGGGWTAHVQGDTIVFASFDTAAHDGTYSITATSAAGTYSQSLDSTAPTDTWTAQASWSEDNGDGQGHLPVMDWTKGNVFQIRYQWLGYGMIYFYVEDPEGGEFTLVHKVKYANSYTVPSVNNPTLPLCAMVGNTSNTSDIVLYTSSMVGFVEGREAASLIRHGFSRTLSISSSTEVPIMALHNKHIFQSKLNRTQIELTFIAITNESGKPAIIHFDVNPTLTDADFSALEVGTSIMDTDISATATTGGDNQFSIVLPSGTSQVIDLTQLDFNIDPLTTFVISGAQTTTGTASVVTVSANWIEHF